MNILSFMEEFPTESACKAHFKTQREQEGVICKKCGSTHQYWLKAKDQWQCSSCNFRTTLKSGSIMEGSKVDFHTWYKAMTFMTYSKKTISASELQRQLNHPKYDTIWRLMHKIRSAMGKRDALYQLEGAIEFDEGYFEKATSEKVKLKRGRGSQRQMNVAVIAESTPIEDIDIGTKSSHCRYFKMKVLSDHKAETINNLAEENFEQKSIVFSDKSTSYVDISDYVEIHITEKSDKTVTKTTQNGYILPLAMPKEPYLVCSIKLKENIYSYI